MLNQSIFSTASTSIKTLDIELQGPIVCDFQIKTGGKFLIYTLEEEIEGYFDKKPVVVGRRSIKEPRIACKILGSPDRLIYQLGISNDIEIMSFGTRFIVNRVKGVTDSLMSTEDEATFIGTIVLNQLKSRGCNRPNAQPPLGYISGGTAREISFCWIRRTSTFCISLKISGQ